MEGYNPASLPKQDEVLKVIDEIPATAADDVSKALPAICRALTHPDASVKVDAADALFVISRRPDGSELLRKYIPAISGLFNEPDWRLQYFSLLVLYNFRPPPIREVLPALLAFLRRTDRDARQQAGVAGYVLRFASPDPQVVGAVLDFLSRPLDQEARMAALNALGNARLEDPNIIDKVIDSLDDPDPAIRSTAFQVLRRMGPAALQQARPAMQKVVDDFVALLRRKDGDVSMQVSALCDLLEYAPEDPQVVDAIEEFFSRPLSPAVRTGALNKLRNLHTTDMRIIDVVIASLKDSDAEARSTAVQVLIDMGPQALMRAQPALGALAQDPDQPSLVRDSAKKALEKIGRNTD